MRSGRSNGYILSNEAQYASDYECPAAAYQPHRNRRQPIPLSVVSAIIDLAAPTLTAQKGE
jgi:hypothetical protein